MQKCESIAWHATLLQAANKCTFYFDIYFQSFVDFNYWMRVFALFQTLFLKNGKLGLKTFFPRQLSLFRVIILSLLNSLSKSTGWEKLLISMQAKPFSSSSPKNKTDFSKGRKNERSPAQQGSSLKRNLKKKNFYSRTTRNNDRTKYTSSTTHNTHTTTHTPTQCTHHHTHWPIL